MQTPRRRRFTLASVLRQAARAAAALALGTAALAAMAAVGPAPRGVKVVLRQAAAGRPAAARSSRSGAPISPFPAAPYAPLPAADRPPSDSGASSPAADPLADRLLRLRRAETLGEWFAAAAELAGDFPPPAGELSHDAMAAAVRDPSLDPEVRAALVTAAAAAEWGAVDAFADLLHDSLEAPEARLRESAVVAAAHGRDPRTVPRLIVMLERDPDAATRAAAVQVLQARMAEDRRARPALEAAATGSPWPGTRADASRALADTLASDRSDGDSVFRESFFD